MRRKACRIGEKDRVLRWLYYRAPAVRHLIKTPITQYTLITTLHSFRSKVVFCHGERPSSSNNLTEQGDESSKNRNRF